MTPVRSSTSAPVARSRLRIWLGDSSWSTTTMPGRDASASAGSGGAGAAAAVSKRCRALERGGGAMEPITPVPPVSAASSASLPLPSSEPAPVPSRFCDTVPATS